MNFRGSESDECQLLNRLRSTPEIFAEIGASSAAELKNQRRLRERFPEELVRAALTLHELRLRARPDYPQADRLWLTRTGLEQATAVAVAQHKAQRFSGQTVIADLCCGIGVDTAALSKYASVNAFDSDSAMCLRCEWNSDVWGTLHPVQARCLDVRTENWAKQVVHVDPDRRHGRERPTKRLEEYMPPLEWMQELIGTAAGGALKLGPASNFMQKFPGCEVELISLNGECREATVWFGELAGEYSFRATVLRSQRSVSSDEPAVAVGDPANETLSVSADPLSAWASTAAEVGTWLHDPDPAVVRSGLLDVIAEQHNLQRLDPEEEYLTGDAPVDSGFVTSFRVEAVLPNSLKELKAWTRRDPSKYYEIKCRHIPADATLIRRQLAVGDAPPRVILIARIAGVARTVIARREPSA